MDTKVMVYLIRVCGWTLIALAGMYASQIRYLNPHLTETQILAQEWEAWATITIMLISGLIASNTKMDNSP